MDTKVSVGGLGGTSDPLAKLRLVGAQNWFGETPCKMETLSSVWNAKFELRVRGVCRTGRAGRGVASLEIEVEDWDQASGNDFMGRVEIALKPFRDGHRERFWLKLTDRRARRRGRGRRR